MRGGGSTCRGGGGGRFIYSSARGATRQSVASGRKPPAQDEGRHRDALEPTVMSAATIRPGRYSAGGYKGGAGRAWRRCACALVLLAATLVRTDASKRAEMSPVPFMMGSRYGRSSQRVMSPRTDRFFMGSRYGKRSEPGSGLGREVGRAEGAVPPGEQQLTCEYTGVLQLYRCRARGDAAAAYDTTDYRKLDDNSISSDED